jgi:hypothetical protein
MAFEHRKRQDSGHFRSIRAIMVQKISTDAPKGSFAEADPKPPMGTFRLDIEGLRAVAVGAVLLYHAGVPFARGGYVGVDVFFVISGFLITGLLVRELEKTERISLTRFYSRRAKRLLPSTVVVLAFAVLVALALPLYDPVRMEELSLGAVASALYEMNWLLAIRATDYFAAELQGSPVQHFWTLAVEEQFYVIWPALLLGGAWLSRRAGSATGARGVLRGRHCRIACIQHLLHGGASRGGLLLHAYPRVGARARRVACHRPGLTLGGAISLGRLRPGFGRPGRDRVRDLPV